MELLFTNPPLLSPEAEQRKRAERALGILEAAKAAPQGEDNRWVVWVDMHRKMDEALGVESLMGFQSHPEIGPQITGGSGRHFLDMIDQRLGARKLRRLLSHYTETACGKPGDLTQERGVFLTVTAMRHLYHLAMAREHMKLCFARAPDVVEVGGGFGNLARMFVQTGGCRRYFIIDHPVLLAIQYFFITEFHPPESVAVLVGQGDYLMGDESCPYQLFSSFSAEGLPPRLKDPYALVSTMALTEIPPEGQRQYLELLDPAFAYIFGQLENHTVGGGRSAESLMFGNQGLVFSLAERFHTLEYHFHGYHFEYMGRAFPAPAGRLQA